MESNTYEVVIIGSGPGGLTAAMYCARAGLKTVCLDRMGAGGQMLSTELIDNYPGFPEGIGGMELGDKMAEQAKRWGAEITYGEVKSFGKRGPDCCIDVETDSGKLKCRALIIATGAGPKMLGVPGEEKLRGRGVSYCAVCDGNFYKGQTVCVVGGGDSAVEEAVYLSHICEKVHIIHRRDVFRAEQAAKDAAMARPNIIINWSCVVEEVVGEEAVTAVKIK